MEDEVQVGSAPDTRPNVPEIDPREAWEQAQRGEAIIVDVREPEELAEIAVSGTIDIPLGQLPDRVEEIPGGETVLFLCRSGNRSSYATDFYRQRVSSQAANIAGGIIAWSEQGLPTRSGG